MPEPSVYVGMLSLWSCDVVLPEFQEYSSTQHTLQVHATPVPGTGPSEVQRAVDLGTEELDGGSSACPCFKEAILFV